MRSSVLCVFAIAFLLAASPASAGERPDLDWSQLVDQSVQDYDDPYRELAPEQLISVVTVARLREIAEKGESIDQERLSRETASLAADGIDVDNLITQRWIVAERRERAATAGSKAVDGREVALSGFVIPAPVDTDGMATAYLVAERGMCSHMPPPSPNQVVFGCDSPTTGNPRPCMSLSVYPVGSRSILQRAGFVSSMDWCRCMRPTQWTCRISNPQRRLEAKRCHELALAPQNDRFSACLFGADFQYPRIG
jgi:hypothetical protein